MDVRKCPSPIRFATLNGSTLPQGEGEIHYIRKELKKICDEKPIQPPHE
jgi:hypothetical protein